MSPAFISPPDPAAYNIQVWKIVQQVPVGHVVTYGQVAKMIPPPDGIPLQEYSAFSPRWVGGAMAACPDNVPWQRVVNSEGKISARQHGGEQIQRQLLEEEGVVFDERGRIDLKRFGWTGQTASSNQMQMKF